MAASPFQLALLKVLIAIGWADGEFSESERALVRRWMAEFSLSEQQCNYLRYYLEQPTTRQQAEAFSRELVEAAHRPEEREVALERLRQLACADERLDEAEKRFLEEVSALFASAGDLGLFANRLRGFFAVRPFKIQRSADAHLAELEAELLWLWKERDHPGGDFARHLKAGGQPSDRQRALLFVGALAGCTWGELKRPLPAATSCIRECLRLEDEQAEFVEQMLSDPYVRSLDRARLVRGVENYADRPLALGLVELLFCLAATDGTIDDEETETIRGMALGLKVTHRMFIDSKLRYGRKQP
ncbi:TerB family tellurite resistance protein [Gloeobacter kilaueensis]|uniref:Co-chaperone DjlA N-terminal domain-containing protein n=1 Tax=Gloeobacter kilaueensis (strain ATCC BAA-2537 / CCAP 1431/1 / ULC 316 / JS1) TaxID=1183438 RepID=U5QH91_GLOK1|nr:TerB family tellurite resistance protein [Gloeobacter kilaueensis]AGY58312.1 hypothetical protein GKIL_2066 [Gloeobacter kilaueensis JS1]